MPSLRHSPWKLAVDGCIYSHFLAAVGVKTTPGNRLISMELVPTFFSRSVSDDRSTLSIEEPRTSKPHESMSLGGYVESEYYVNFTNEFLAPKKGGSVCLCLGFPPVNFRDFPGE